MTPRQAFNKIRELQRSLPKMLLEASQEAAYDVGADVQKMSGSYSFTGKHSSSWAVGAIRRGSELRNDVPYAIVLETGRRAGAKQPPIKALMPWVAAKLGATTGKSQRRAAYLLAKKIKLRGSPAKGTLFKNYSRWEQQAQNVFAREIESRVKSKLP